jgi:coniferyl-aldehyde dehydrogenase
MNVATNPAGVEMPAMRQLFDRQRAAFLAEMNPSRAARLDRLARLEKAVDAFEPRIIESIAADFGGRPSQVTRLADTFQVLGAIRHARGRLGRWMRTRRLPTAPKFWPAHNRLQRQPLGVVGIVAPWNYPLNLALCPAVAALAAGNRAMIKPSELTPRFSATLAEMIAGAFAAEEMTVVQGDADVGRAFVELPFDHLLFTGSTAVGRAVAVAAARNLTPVTLELGGKSPAIVDGSADLTLAARRIAYGKLFNAGQTCIAPDYALVPVDERDAFVAALGEAVAAQYPTLDGNPDYTSIVSDRHMARLTALVEDAKAQGASIVELAPRGGASGAPGAQRIFAPTLVLGATNAMRVMQEEIFGPILPVMTYLDLGQALAQVNEGPRPLALYWFGTDRARRERVLAGTIAGGVTINDCLLHFAQEDAPFGGVGDSGQGAYHGEYGFRTFSKETPIHVQGRWSGIKLLYPPYGRRFETMAGLLRRFG